MTPLSFDIRPTNYAEHHNSLDSWWSARTGGVPFLAEVMWPPCGFVAYLDDVPLAAAFTYLNAPWCQIAWYATDPNADIVTRSAALEAVITFSLDNAHKNGCTTALITCQNRGMIRLLKRMKFIVGDTHVTHLMRSTWLS